MAAKKRSKKKLKLADLPAQEDAAAELDSALLLRAAQPVLKALAADLLRRAKESPAVTAALRARHRDEKEAERTADPFETWLRAFVEQVAAAWLLSCVFVRVLEDRGLAEQNRIAGPGALDSQQLFFELAPSLSERDYLRTVFRELSQLPAAGDLFDARHNPVWLLAPSAEGARALLELFRTPSPHAPALRFGQSSTRFLGDLYQDLSESVRKRYALLQTPDFIEEFILDRTLERAIERFGLDETTLIDPTCGSGHFLLGAFDRLVEHRLRNEPGLDVREAALKALDAVSGADINPYAIAIARFRLTLAYLEKAGHTKLAQAPKLPLHLAVADSLLHNPQKQMGLGEVEGADRASFEGEIYALEDEEATRDVLYRRYAAVVGNPPYITVKDKALRDKYRSLYATCHREYSVAVPFKERFFQLAKSGGAVGMITANSFMKREFGKKVIEEFLPTVNLDLIVNTSGAYIPGHGTPTVLLFGTAEPPRDDEILTVLAKRGEPSTPANPAQGRVWSSIAGHWSAVGYDDDYITVAATKRDALAEHPWSLAGGGASELKSKLESGARTRLGEIVESIGFMCITKEDNVFPQPREVLRRFGAEQSWTRPFVIGEHVRDWQVDSDLAVVFPYDDLGELRDVSEVPRIHRFLWPVRTVLESRAVFGGKTFREAGREWWAFGQIPKDRITGPAIVFAEVATHNHFALCDGGKASNQTAPIIKLPADASEDDHLVLLAFLNSSTACFWMKQVAHSKGSGTDKGKWQDDPAKIAYQFAATPVGGMPLPPIEGEARARLITLATDLGSLADARAALPDEFASDVLAGQDVETCLKSYREQDEDLLRRQIALQEQLDWLVYDVTGLLDEPNVPSASLQPLPLGARAFERRAAAAGAISGTDGQRLTSTVFESAETAEFRDRALARSRHLRLLESPDFKRRWAITPKELGGRVLTFSNRAEGALLDRLASHVEALVVDLAKERRPVSAPSLATALANEPPIASAAHHLHGHLPGGVLDLLRAEAIPFLSCLRFKDTGIEKHEAWLATWAAQRAEDAGTASSAPTVPPKYARRDYATERDWELRGKLDVPKERFISYPGCESDEDGEPLYGWAGWSHLERAQALAALYEQRKSEGWDAARLTPMLAGILELVPWVQQWHNEPSDEYDGMRLGDYFQGYLDGECAQQGLSLDDLRAWRPPTGGRSRRAKAAS